ncbi:hypothetical protein DSO57_1002835 [Entomophthora muscae]|uniref:Uncharacterized protein n=1 Tax=Entomophthora muscae TaxID=34485 RepID=A0ACC2RZT3_9FUNG|nr:hypothetical protein DSO57_1002835 [Entomophthora muscae]
MQDTEQPTEDQGPELGTIESTKTIKIMYNTPKIWVEVVSEAITYSCGQLGCGVKGGSLGLNRPVVEDFWFSGLCQGFGNSIATKIPLSPANVSHDTQGVLDESPHEVSNSMDQSNDNIKLQALSPNYEHCQFNIADPCASYSLAPPRIDNSFPLETRAQEGDLNPDPESPQAAGPMD